MIKEYDSLIKLSTYLVLRFINSCSSLYTLQVYCMKKYNLPNYIGSHKRRYTIFCFFLFFILQKKNSQREFILFLESSKEPSKILIKKVEQLSEGNSKVHIIALNKDYD